MGGLTRTSWVKGQITNPKGRPPKTDAQREAERMLVELSPRAVAKLGELLECDDVKIQAMVALGITKATIGELNRVAGKDGESLRPHSSLTVEELKAVARAQLAKEKE